MTTMGYVTEKFYEAVHTLVGEGFLRDRLAGAALALIRLREEDIPEGELRTKIVGIIEDLTRVESTGDEGNIAATTTEMDDVEAHDLAERILSMFVELMGDLPA